MEITDIELPVSTGNTPYLLGAKDPDKIITIDGILLTAENMWKLTPEQRRELLWHTFEYYRKKGFPYELLNDAEISEKFMKLRKFEAEKVITPDGFLSNTGSICLDVCRSINHVEFWKTRGETTPSPVEVFNNDELFIKVLKNRMGWNTSTEDGVERNYLFNITGKMIRTGIVNSGLGVQTSNFRPTIAKWIYWHYLKNVNYVEHPIVFDYSAGWGARCLAAASLDIDYIGVDPNTADNIQCCANMLKDFDLTKSNITVIQGVSEDSSLYDMVPQVDMCMSCPPYYVQEIYSNDETQSTSSCKTYNEWLEAYWMHTVMNCKRILKTNGLFIIVIKDAYKKYNLKNDMCGIIESCGFKFVEEWQYKTSRNHLSGKRKTGVKIKNSEYIVVFKKVDTEYDLQVKTEKQFAYEEAW